MADNVAITAGTGTDVATDDVAGVHYQRVKLVDGTLDSTAAIPGDATNGLDVDVTRVSGNVTVVQATPANLMAEVEGTVAHDAAVSTSQPVQIGGVATASLVGETAVAADDITHLHTTTDGRLLTHPFTSPENIVSGAITDTTGNSVAVIAAGASGVITYLTHVSIFNSSASSVACQVKDGTTVKLELWLPAGGGVSLTFPTPLRGTAATAWNVDAGAATTTIYANYVGFQSKV